MPVAESSRTAQHGVADDWLGGGDEQAIHGSGRWTYGSWSMGTVPKNRGASVVVRNKDGVFVLRRARRDQTRRSPEELLSTADLRHRLDNANNHFRRKAADVLGDEDAILLLSVLFEESSLLLSDFDSCNRAIALARLTAANFCEIGAKVIYITEAGQNFIESLDNE